MPSINAATISPPAGKRWREAPEDGHRESCGHTASVTDVRNPAIARWQTHTHNQRGRSGQAGDKIHRGIRLRVGPCKTEEYYAGKNGGACLNNL